eukprot:2188104-Rhodomonas_salina.2
MVLPFASWWTTSCAPCATCEASSAGSDTSTRMLPSASTPRSDCCACTCCCCCCCCCCACWCSALRTAALLRSGVPVRGDGEACEAAGSDEISAAAAVIGADDELERSERGAGSGLRRGMAGGEWACACGCGSESESESASQP